MKILYCVGGGLGNVVHTTPTITALRSLGHDVTVHVTAEWPGVERLIDHDAVVTGPLPDLDPFERVIASPYAFTGSHAWPKGKPIPDKLREGTSPLPPDRTAEVEGNMWFARVLGYSGLTPPPTVRHSDTSPVSGDYLVIAPGVQRAMPIWAKKQYPYWPAVAASLFGKSIQIVVVGTPSDIAPEWEPYHNLCGKTSLWDLSGVLYKARAVVGVDNGPTCLSAAEGVPTLVLWGPTSAVKNRKYGPCVVDLYSGAPCRPCQFRPDEFLACQEVRCMKAIDPQLAVRYALEVWEEGR